jgi:hypothetical protein
MWRGTSETKREDISSDTENNIIISSMKSASHELLLGQ